MSLYVCLVEEKFFSCKNVGLIFISCSTGYRTTEDEVKFAVEKIVQAAA